MDDLKKKSNNNKIFFKSNDSKDLGSEKESSASRAQRTRADCDVRQNRRIRSIRNLVLERFDRQTLEFTNTK